MVLMQYSREHPDAQMAAQILALEETAWPSDGEKGIGLPKLVFAQRENDVGVFECRFVLFGFGGAKHHHRNQSESIAAEWFFCCAAHKACAWNGLPTAACVKGNPFRSAGKDADIRAMVEDKLASNLEHFGTKPLILVPWVSYDLA